MMIASKYGRGIQNTTGFYKYLSLAQGWFWCCEERPVLFGGELKFVSGGGLGRRHSEIYWLREDREPEKLEQLEHMELAYTCHSRTIPLILSVRGGRLHPVTIDPRWLSQSARPAKSCEREFLSFAARNL